MLKSTLQYEGRVFEFQYEEPTGTAIAARAQEIQKDKPWQSLTVCEDEARSELTNRKYNKAHERAVKALKKYWSDLEMARADVGISQRKSHKIDISKLDGVITREIRSDSMSKDPQVITDDELQNGPTQLCYILNDHLLELHKNRGDRRYTDLYFPTPDKSKRVQEQIHDIAAYAGGFGEADSQMIQEFTQLNRFGKSLLPNSRELVGYTFITRPHCNMTQANISNSRKFAALLNAEDNSIAKGIRWSLDTELALSRYGVESCMWCDVHNPFLVLACNALKSINGFPDPTLAVETTEGGFFSEQQSNVIGYDRLAHGQDLQLMFRDYQNGPVMALHSFWSEYAGLLGDGTLVQYMDDIENNLMGYTVSIYRFVMDPTGRYITRWAKATGCYPKMSPDGTVFNVNQGEYIVTAAHEFTIPYQAHHFGYNDPAILEDFNMLVRRYCPSIAEGGEGRNINPTIINNRAGMPYIVQDGGYNELVWRLPTSGFVPREPIHDSPDHEKAKEPYVPMSFPN